MVWKLDRLGRSVRQLVELVGQLQSQEVHFVSLTDSIDTSTPSGRFFFHVMAALAEMERDLIRERTTAGLRIARAQGRLGGRRPEAHPSAGEPRPTPPPRSRSDRRRSRRNLRCGALNPVSRHLEEGLCPSVRQATSSPVPPETLIDAQWPEPAWDAPEPKEPAERPRSCSSQAPQLRRQRGPAAQRRAVYYPIHR